MTRSFRFILPLLAVFGCIFDGVAADLQPSQEQRAIKVMHRLAGDDLTAYLGFTPQVELLHSPLLDAFVSKQGKISITTGFFDLLPSDDSELAFLLAHEISHHILNHHRSARFQGTKSLKKAHLRREIAADALAIRMLHEAGFDTLAGQRLLEKILNFARENELPMGAIYPSLQLRLLKLRAY